MRRFIWISLLVGSMLCSSGCTEGFFERQDKKRVEGQLHLPKNIKYLSFQSYPRSAAWFGREGLLIKAEFEFAKDEFKAYVDNLNNSAFWKPVAFDSYLLTVGWRKLFEGRAQLVGSAIARAVKKKVFEWQRNKAGFHQCCAWEVLLLCHSIP